METNWLPPAWRRLLLIGFDAKQRQDLAPLLASAAEGAVLDHAHPDDIEPDPDGGTLLILALEVENRPAEEWLRERRMTGDRMPALLLAKDADRHSSGAPPADLLPCDLLKDFDPDQLDGKGQFDPWPLRRSLGYLRQTVADQRLADEIRRRLQAYDAAGSGDADHARIMEIARGLRAQLDEKEAEAEHLAARCEELQARLEGDEPLSRRVRELEEQLSRSEELRKGQELAMDELRRRKSEPSPTDEAGSPQSELMARLMFSEWMRSSQQQQLQYLQKNLDERDSRFQALATLLETPEGEPDRLLEAVASRLMAYEKERGEQQSTISRMSHSLAVQQVDDALDDAQSRRNAIQRLDDAMAYARRFDATLACLMISIDDPDDLRQAHGSVAYDFLLVQLAQRLKISLRQHDVLLRYDSESFVLISDTQSTAGAHTHASRLIDQVSSEPVHLAGRALRPSISISIVLRHPLMKDAREFIARAQKVLAKGRAKWGPGRIAVDPRSVKQERDLT